MIEIWSASGMMISFAVDGHTLKASADWNERIIGLTCDICSKVHTIEDTHVVTHIINVPTCTAPGSTRDVMSADVRGLCFEVGRHISTPALEHDYNVNYIWATDGSNCKVKFSCRNDPTDHFGEFTIYSKDIESKRDGGKTVYSVTGTVQSIRVNSSHTVYDDEGPISFGYPVAIVSALAALGAATLVFRRFRP